MPLKNYLLVVDTSQYAPGSEDHAAMSKAFEEAVAKALRENPGYAIYPHHEADVTLHNGDLTRWVAGTLPSGVNAVLNTQVILAKQWQALASIIDSAEREGVAALKEKVGRGLAAVSSFPRGPSIARVVLPLGEVVEAEVFAQQAITPLRPLLDIVYGGAASVILGSHGWALIPSHGRAAMAFRGDGAAKDLATLRSAEEKLRAHLVSEGLRILDARKDSMNEVLAALASAHGVEAPQSNHSEPPEEEEDEEETITIDEDTQKLGVAISCAFKTTASLQTFLRDHMGWHDYDALGNETQGDHAMLAAIYAENHGQEQELALKARKYGDDNRAPIDRLIREKGWVPKAPPVEASPPVMLSEEETEALVWALYDAFVTYNGLRDVATALGWSLGTPSTLRGLARAAIDCAQKEGKLPTLLTSAFKAADDKKAKLELWMKLHGLDVPPTREQQDTAAKANRVARHDALVDALYVGFDDVRAFRTFLQASMGWGEGPEPQDTRLSTRDLLRKATRRAVARAEEENCLLLFGREALRHARFPARLRSVLDSAHEAPRLTSSDVTTLERGLTAAFKTTPSLKAFLRDTMGWNSSTIEHVDVAYLSLHGVCEQVVREALRRGEEQKLAVQAAAQGDDNPASLRALATTLGWDKGPTTMAAMEMNDLAFALTSACRTPDALTRFLQDTMCWGSPAMADVKAAMVSGTFHDVGVRVVQIALRFSIVRYLTTKAIAQWSAGNTAPLRAFVSRFGWGETPPPVSDSQVTAAGPYMSASDEHDLTVALIAACGTQEKLLTYLRVTMGWGTDALETVVAVSQGSAYQGARRAVQIARNVNAVHVQSLACWAIPQWEGTEGSNTALLRDFISRHRWPAPPSPQPSTTKKA